VLADHMWASAPLDDALTEPLPAPPQALRAAPWDQPPSPPISPRD